MNSVLKAEEKIKKHAAVEKCALIEADKSEPTADNDVILVVKKSKYYEGKPDCIVITEIMAYARDILTSQEVPEEIVFVEAIPMTSKGEINKKALQKMVLP